MSQPLLYDYALDADCYGIRLAAGCLGIELALRSVDVHPGQEQRSPAMLALNPQGRLPVLTDGALTLTQPLSILLYLAESYAPDHPLMPQDALTGARMLDWMSLAAATLAPCAQARACAMMSAPGNLSQLRSDARRALRLFDDHMALQELRGEGFLAGAEATLADLMLFPALALSRDYGLDHDAFPALALWARRVRRLPGFHTMPGVPDYH